MPSIQTQLHGYRQGHELLSGPKELPKADQSLIDRLSDLAGPLRPGEQFAPYFTGYPLPSGSHYVLARTWQDLAVARAGCVRTLSMLIPAEEWKRSASPASYFHTLNVMTILPEVAVSLDVPNQAPPLPPVIGFAGDELLEALFLEESKPVAVFDTDSADLVAARLLSALWPGMRERFSVSTFALAPRKIDSRFFDLVFAPKDVRSRFANWPGRRVDARSGKVARHRWTHSIVDRVFRSANPRLLDEKELDALSDDERGTTSALRIALLWDELLEKIETSPSAALGLLDVASSKFARSASTNIVEISPLLADAAERAAAEMPPEDGWAFVTAMLRKVIGTPFAPVVPAISNASQTLARRSPAGAVALLEQPDPSGTYRVLLPSIARGLDEGFASGGDRALADALPETLASVLISDRELTRSALQSAAVIRRISEVLPALHEDAYIKLRRQLAPQLHTPEHAQLAASLIGSMPTPELLEEVDVLARQTKLSLPTFVPIVVDRSRELGAEIALREKAIGLGATAFARQLLQQSLIPGSRDARWVAYDAPDNLAPDLISLLLRQANGSQLTDVFRDHDLARRIISLLSRDDADILLRVVRETWLPIDLFVSLVARLGSSLPEGVAGDLARQALQRCLREHFPGDEVAALRALLQAARGAVDTAWIIHNGLAGTLNSSVVSRNMVVFSTVTPALARDLAGSVDAIAEVLAGRWWIDLDRNAASALTMLLTASQDIDRYAALRASGTLLSALMRSTDHPVSSVLAVAFPLVYLELARDNETADFLRFIPFTDWDRCKSARHEFVNAYLDAHVWRPSDFALTAWRCGDTERFVRRLAKSYRGNLLVDGILSALSELPAECARDVKSAIHSVLRSNL